MVCTLRGKGIGLCLRWISHWHPPPSPPHSPRSVQFVHDYRRCGERRGERQRKPQRLPRHCRFYYSSRMEKNRLEAFSDGVLAIIITIMVLEMKVPHGSDLEALKPTLPIFLSYVLSYIYLGIY